MNVWKFIDYCLQLHLKWEFQRIYIILIAFYYFLNVSTAPRGRSTNDTNIKKWYNNADDISTALYGINPYFGSLDDLKKMMHHHLELTTVELQSRIKKDGSDIYAFENVLNEILEMSDALTDGIVLQHKRKFL